MLRHGLPIEVLAQRRQKTKENGEKGRKGTNRSMGQKRRKSGENTEKRLNMRSDKVKMYKYKKVPETHKN